MSLLSVLVWAACTALRELMHWALRALFAASEGKGAAGIFTLLLVMLPSRNSFLAAAKEGFSSTSSLERRWS